MAVARVPLAEFTARSLPSVCAVSGGLAREQYALVAPAKDGPVVGAICLSENVANTMRSLRRSSLLLFFGSIVVMSVAAATRSGALAICAAMAVMAAIGCLSLLSRRIVRATVEDDVVLLTNVHPDFVRALDGSTGRCGDCPGRDECAVVGTDACDDGPTG